MSLSVVIPFYDETIFIRETVASCLALGDTLKDIIIVDDGPLKIEHSLFSGMPELSKISIIHNETNCGPTASRNTGIDAASGDYVMVLDADDLLVPQSMRNALSFAQESRADLVHLPTLCYNPRYGSWERFSRDQDIFARRLSDVTIDDAPQLRYPVATWSWLMRRDFLNERDLRFDPLQKRYVDHLFAVMLTHAAERISAFDEYPHIWRRRGASMSTSPETMEDYRFVLSSIEPTQDLLLLRHAPEDMAFQRDQAFFLARLISTWTLFDHCLPRRDHDQEAADILEALAQKLSRHELQPEVGHDALLAKLCRAPLRIRHGAPVTMSELPAIYQMITSRDWSALEQRLGLVAHGPSDGGKDAVPLPETRWPLAIDCDQEDQRLPARVYLYHARVTDFSDLDRLSKAESIVLQIECPSALLFALYVERVEQAEEYEHRLFSEFLLDECGSLIAFVQALRAGLAERCADLSVEIVSRPAPRSSCQCTCIY